MSGKEVLVSERSLALWQKILLREQDEADLREERVKLIGVLKAVGGKKTEGQAARTAILKAQLDSPEGDSDEKPPWWLDK